MHRLSQIEGTTVRQMIREALGSAENGHLLHRLDGVLLVAEGCSCREVARWFGVDRRTIERWVRAAEVRGLDGLAEHHCGGRPAKLSSAQLQWINLVLQASPGLYGYPDRRWTGKRLNLHLSKHLGLQVGVRSCQRLIARSRSGWRLVR